jgi:hypothetical protein
LRLGVGALQDVAEEHERDRGRDDLAERAGGTDRAGGELGVVAGLEHGRQREEAHGDDGGADDAGRGGEQRADDGDRDGEAAPDPGEQHAHGLQELIGDAGPLQHHPHEDEERDRDQHLVDHGAEVARRQPAEEAEVEDAEPPADAGEDERRAGEREGDRESP